MKTRVAFRPNEDTRRLPQVVCPDELEPPPGRRAARRPGSGQADDAAPVLRGQGARREWSGAAGRAGSGGALGAEPLSWREAPGGAEGRARDLEAGPSEAGRAEAALSVGERWRRVSGERGARGGRRGGGAGVEQMGSAADAAGGAADAASGAADAARGNVMEAVAGGAARGLAVAASVGAMIVAFVSLQAHPAPSERPQGDPIIAR
jgi:hypothetical protein